MSARAIALLGAADPRLAPALEREGLRAVVAAERLVGPARLADAALRRRGFTEELPGGALAFAALRRERPDVAHAFSPPAAQAALLWRRRARRPVVFTCTEALDRGRVADRRLRYELLAAALAGADAVVVADEPARQALDRWMLAEAEVIDPADGPAHVALYERLLAARR